MANQKIFCNVPWTNLHVYWDGKYGVCCSERSPFSDEDHSLQNMSISDWYSSEVMESVRERISSDTPLPQCSSCYKEESIGYESRRIKENFKSAIFTERAFERSYQQSPWIDRFDSKTSPDLPRDWHIDFGNECNFACKMCHAGASSTIAAHLRRSGDHSGAIKTSWTEDPAAWQRFVEGIAASKIQRIHVMGGEPTLMRSYERFVDHLIDEKRFEISLSFVTNGSSLSDRLLWKLKQFRSADVELSIETLDSRNDYIRQGCDIDKLKSTLERVYDYQDDRFQVVLRTVPQLLSIASYAELVGFAWEKGLIIEGIPLTRPRFMAIDVMEKHTRTALIKDFESLLERIPAQQNRLQNGRNRATLDAKLARECRSMISLLGAEEPENVQELRDQLVKHCMFWDKIYGLDARRSHPELADMLEAHGYGS